MGYVRRYQRYVGRRLNRTATWSPTKQFELGQYGIIDRSGCFHAFGNVKDLGFEFDPMPDGSKAQIMQRRTREFEVVGKADARTDKLAEKIANAKAGFTAKFGTSGSFIMKFDGCQETYIENLGELTKALKGSSKIQDRMVVIGSIITVDAGFVLVSTSFGCDIAVTASGDISSFAEIGGEVSVSYSSKDLEIYEMKKGNTPLCMVYELKHGHLYPVID